ncbi:ATP-binding cassette domain-containing protein [Mesorhizobium sp. M2A.F.Ca.ET.037.01.1.1]|nr:MULTISPECIES: ABC transporter ATP-binding protein [unclassified Mesorhizobium]RUY12699.1 ATP-binding cassette domain-containing protein [Mesorhizobium sp. M2A.F.Ca.ET.040.01.1.1]RVC71053.1 ATP-binding cassette domain-containing protein [Mesorhizobium sp. M00.F.Ca.ET.038.03.1.1]RVC80635.1 ATP-binding cassette domain-containing protein [Mesorhizobium sp. M2A.F.Ca.ET.046.02.1.1]AZO34848.1 ABC transporter ATP-binding protein [Mesorhizobium sp. M2A.F.Ca.ET.046.03.2.1]RUX22641.1 ATP-binding casse
MTSPSKLSIEHLSVKFGQVVALNDVSLQVNEGEFVSILGASGCGKSTLFNAVSGLLRATSGKIKLDGRDVSNRPGEVGYMLQKDLMLPWRTVRGNITLAASLTRGATKEDQAEAEKLATRYGLGEFLNHYPHALSGGMRQRVAMMRTIAAGRQVMLLDEPFGALDAQTRFSMQQWLLQVWKDLGRTILFVTHDVDEAIFLADRIVVMTPRPGRIGEVVQVGLPRPRSLEDLTTEAFTALKRQIMARLYHDEQTAGAAK